MALQISLMMDISKCYMTFLRRCGETFRRRSQITTCCTMISCTLRYPSSGFSHRNPRTRSEKIFEWSPSHRLRHPLRAARETSTKNEILQIQTGYGINDSRCKDIPWLWRGFCYSVRYTGIPSMPRSYAILRHSDSF